MLSSSHSYFFHVHRVPVHKFIAAVTFIAEKRRRSGTESKDRIFNYRTTCSDGTEKIAKMIVVRAFVTILYFIYQLIWVEHAFSPGLTHHRAFYRRRTFRTHTMRACHYHFVPFHVHRPLTAHKFQVRRSAGSVYKVASE